MIWVSDPKDRASIVGLVKEAFSSPEHDGQLEVDIVEKTWALGAELPGLELVAIEDELVVGHVLGARADLEGNAIVAVAPLSVAPSWRRQGIGTALMGELLRHADAQRWPLAVVLGDPSYYRRFGFEASAPYGIFYRPAGEDNPNFQIRRLSAFDRSLRGEVRYCWELPAD